MNSCEREFASSDDTHPEEEKGIVVGDTNYVVTSLRSGSVVATTLTVKHKHVPRDIATSYTTVFDVADWPMQYMLDTPIDGATANQMDFLNGSHWIRIPPPTMTYMYKGQPSEGRIQDFSQWSSAEF